MKLIDVDYDKKRISLSMKALLAMTRLKKLKRPKGGSKMQVETADC